RPHPLRPVGLPGIPTQDTQAHKEPDFTDCGLAVTISSNSGVLSVLSGIPTVALDDRSMAWGVTARDYEAVTPDRTQWAHHLAWKQWTRDEIANGDAWDALKGLS
ncbi:MAG: hypothetical protein Q7Q73_05765, partial [Verrucomicrobiota bacterium JB024]|nr:hypothetical protein [Verrucomicrobiota bacterium JB024]